MPVMKSISTSFSKHSRSEETSLSFGACRFLFPPSIKEAFSKLLLLLLLPAPIITVSPCQNYCLKLRSGFCTAWEVEEVMARYDVRREMSAQAFQERGFSTLILKVTHIFFSHKKREVRKKKHKNSTSCFDEEMEGKLPKRLQCLSHSSVIMHPCEEGSFLHKSIRPSFPFLRSLLHPMQEDSSHCRVRQWQEKKRKEGSCLHCFSPPACIITGGNKTRLLQYFYPNLLQQSMRVRRSSWGCGTAMVVLFFPSPPLFLLSSSHHLQPRRSCKQLDQ